MKKVLVFVLIVTVLVGCSKGEALTDEHVVDIKKEPGILNSQNKEKSEEQIVNIEESKTIVEESKDVEGKKLPKNNFSLEYIENNIEIGMSESEILELLGEPDVKGRDPLNGLPNWRFDVGASDNYDHEYDEFYKEQGLIGEIDVNNLKNQNLDMQLFIGFYNGTVIHVANAYLENGEVRVYHLLSDGTRKVDWNG